MLIRLKLDSGLKTEKKSFVINFSRDSSFPSRGFFRLRISGDLAEWWGKALVGECGGINYASSSMDGEGYAQTNVADLKRKLKTLIKSEPFTFRKY